MLLYKYFNQLFYFSLFAVRFKNELVLRCTQLTVDDDADIIRGFTHSNTGDKLMAFDLDRADFSSNEAIEDCIWEHLAKSSEHMDEWNELLLAKSDDGMEE